MKMKKNIVRRLNKHHPLRSIVVQLFVSKMIKGLRVSNETIGSVAKSCKLNLRIGLTEQDYICLNRDIYTAIQHSNAPSMHRRTCNNRTMSSADAAMPAKACVALFTKEFASNWTRRIPASAGMTGFSCIRTY